MAEQPEPRHFLHKLMNPQSLCIFGANENLLQNMGCQELLNILDNGYKGNVYPIHPRLETVLGLQAYKTISDVPEVPDLAIILLPKRIVPQVLTEIGEKGTKTVILVTAGFRETNNADAEQEIIDIAQKYGVHPNQVTKWKKQLIESASDLFERANKKHTPDDEELIKDKLYKHIGEMKVENEFLKKKYRQIYGCEPDL